ncbi:MAG: FCD domain-containing protein [Pseudomonadota bacterium]|jgi:GntR family transcriptional repressor for pyruvate dehydrogenase complex|nr:FCD domain-containing protein [Pseudomonadota bacterium]
MSPATLQMKIEKNDGSRASKPLRVAEAIKHWVVAEGMRPGDKLPSESELMERYGHSKGTIRESMRILEAQGLLKTRTGPGGGSFVHEVSEARTRALLANYFYFRDLTIQDIYQLRKQLEPDLVYSLAGKLSDDVLDELKSITDQYAEPPGDAEEDRRHHEIALTFHAKLAEQSENQLLGFIIRFMADTLSEVTTSRRLFEPTNRELWSKGREYQLRVLKALRAGNGQMARDVMLEHMQFAEKLMIQQELRVKRQFGDF